MLPRHTTDTSRSHLTPTLVHLGRKSSEVCTHVGWLGEEKIWAKTFRGMDLKDLVVVSTRGRKHLYVLCRWLADPPGLPNTLHLLANAPFGAPRRVCLGLHVSDFQLVGLRIGQRVAALRVGPGGARESLPRSDARRPHLHNTDIDGDSGTFEQRGVPR